MKLLARIKQNENLMRFIETTQKRITDSEMGTTSVVVAYYLLLSLFPLIIAFGNILPFLHIDQETVLTYVREVIPETIYQFIGPAVKNLLTHSSGGLLSVSALAALWSASQSINCHEQSVWCGKQKKLFDRPFFFTCSDPFVYVCNQWSDDRFRSWTVDFRSNPTYF